MKHNQNGNTIHVKPGGGRWKKVLINLLVTLVVGAIYFYVELPALNLHNERFYFFFFILSAVYCGVSIVTSGIWKLQQQDEFLRSVKNNCKVPLLLCAGLLVLLLVGTLLSSVILRADAYSKLLPVTESNFTQDVTPAQFDQIPLLDRDSAERLGNRKLGELSDMVSQFEVSTQNTQINFQSRPVRVTPLVYADLIKWLTNRNEGLPAYLIIDMVTQNVELVRLAEGMKYTTDEHFGRNLYRHLRFQYPTYMFDEPRFEIDEEGNPYWICPRLVKTIGLFGGTDIDGAVLVNAVTGESQYYDAPDVPTWVDRVFTSELIIEQYDYYGQYKNGFFNSLFGQKDVTVTTEGYNYIAMYDDVFMYTGVTSVGGDQSNIGFILTNQRTKDTRFYRVAGAEEFSAMSSAQGQVQHLNYTATFPLLLNINGEPTYFMALKDRAGLVKMYAMVNVRQYQLVATGTTVAGCEQEYEKLLLSSNVIEEEKTATTTAEGVVIEKREAVLGGDTYYYLKLDSTESYYVVSAADSPVSVIVNVGDRVSIRFVGDAGGELLATTTLERIAKAAENDAPAAADKDSADAADAAGEGEGEPPAADASEEDTASAQDNSGDAQAA